MDRGRFEKATDTAAILLGAPDAITRVTFQGITENGELRVAVIRAEPFLNKGPRTGVLVADTKDSSSYGVLTFLDFESNEQQSLPGISLEDLARLDAPQSQAQLTPGTVDGHRAVHSAIFGKIQLDQRQWEKYTAHTGFYIYQGPRLGSLALMEVPAIPL